LTIPCYTGFDYNFNSLRSPDENQNELYESIRSMLKAEGSEFVFILQLFFPLFRPIVRFYPFHPTKNRLYISFLQPTARSRLIDRSLGVIRRIGSQLIQDKKAAVLAELSSDGAGVVEKHDVQGHDLLSLLIKSNIASDMPANMRMSDSEILSRKCPFSALAAMLKSMIDLEVPTFLLAGHETSRWVL
jgi:hypothetical protein